MREVEKLGLQVIGGGILLIVGAYGLFKIFGDSILLALIAIAGWFVLMGFCIRFMRVGKREK